MSFLDPAAVLKEFGAYGTDHVADFGSGAGHFALAAARRLDGGRLYAVDLDRAMLKRLADEARELGFSNVHAVEGDAARALGVPLAAGSVDKALAANVLWALHDREAFASEARRLLRPGGKLLVIEWRGDMPGGPHPHHKVLPDAVCALFERCGFAKERDVNAGDAHYGMIFVRT